MNEKQQELINENFQGAAMRKTENAQTFGHFFNLIFSLFGKTFDYLINVNKLFLLFTLITITVSIAIETFSITAVSGKIVGNIIDN